MAGSRASGHTASKRRVHFHERAMPILGRESVYDTTRTVARGEKDEDSTRTGK